jgi:hypothetical protein
MGAKGDHMEEKFLEMGMPIKSKVIYMASCRKSDSFMEKYSEKGLGGSRHVSCASEVMSQVSIYL